MDRHLVRSFIAINQYKIYNLQPVNDYSFISLSNPLKCLKNNGIILDKCVGRPRAWLYP